MKKKILLIIASILLIAGCSTKPAEVKKEKNVTDPIIVDEAKRVVSEEISRMDDENSPVASYYLEYVFEDNFCSKAIYHTKYKAVVGAEYNLEQIKDDENYQDAYIDDDGYLVYDFREDALIGKSVRDVLTYLQYHFDINVEVYDE